MTFARRTPVFSLDPTRAEPRTLSALSNVFEPLVGYDRDLRLTPALATRWTTPDENTWVFVLRPGVLFHDGTPLDAAAVVAALDRARHDPDSTVGGALWAVSGVEAAGALAVRIRTRVPDALLLHGLRLVLVSRLPDGAGPGVAPSGTGPYRVASWDPEGALDLAAWEKHWAGPPAIPVVRIVPLPPGIDPGDAVARGLADVAEVRVKNTARDAPPGVRYLTSPGLTTWYLWMNGPARIGGRANPFFDARVRRAVARAVDRPRLALEATGTADTAAPQLVPPTVVGHFPSLDAPPSDPAAARAQLAGAGYRLPVAVSLAHRSDNDTDGNARLLAGMLEAAGFRVTLRPMPWEELLVEFREGRVGLFLGGWVFDAPDAGGFLRDCVRSRGEGGSTGVFNPGYVSPRVDRLVDASHDSRAGRDRLSLLEETLRIVTDEAPLVPLFHEPDAWAVSSRLEWTPRLDGRLIATEMRFAGGPP